MNIPVVLGRLEDLCRLLDTADNCDLWLKLIAVLEAIPTVLMDRKELWRYKQLLAKAEEKAHAAPLN